MKIYEEVILLAVIILAPISFGSGYVTKTEALLCMIFIVLMLILRILDRILQNIKYKK
jgi:hypothetical protein